MKKRLVTFPFNKNIDNDNNNSKNEEISRPRLHILKFKFNVEIIQLIYCILKPKTNVQFKYQQSNLHLKIFKYDRKLRNRGVRMFRLKENMVI